MGEYAKLKGTGAEVKIGTCENMYYLRHDQRRLVAPLWGSLDPADRETQEVIRFRFPWPDEDNIDPGEFADPFRRLRVDVPAPEEFEHGIVQFIASSEGYNLCVPCPEGPDQIEGLTIHRNGFAGPAFLVQQAVRDDKLVGIMQCICGRSYRLPTLVDAAPVCEYLLDQAEQHAREKDTSHAQWLIGVATRLRAGYGEEV